MTTTASASPAVYTVSGMTCAHCVKSVTEEVSRIDGVIQVDVDLPTGKVTVTSTGAVDDAAFAAAIDEAGYEVTAAPDEASGSCCGSCH
ncbi:MULTISPECIES: heavy-metal-associated domain-containing protein [unclassified Streptomyces]|uniref:heavy-metal-associated domain-containing protein n=1 Tax=unclassified Streptomyces TaxID=2593676 RepID=UPI002E230132|nr:heavy-metal-associated domain-containing protein [Streptomyces sp. NBC_01023]